MAYGRLEDTFRTNRKLPRLARELGVRRAEARGLIAGLWSWATTNAPDGDLSDLEPLEIEQACDWEGEPGVLFPALLKVHLLDPVADTSRTVSPDSLSAGVEIHNYLRRAEGFRKAKQKQKERARRSGVAPAVARVSRDGGENVAGERRGEERSREERKGSGGAETVVLQLEPLGPPVTRSPAFLEFPADGKPDVWAMTEALIAEWSDSFPSLDVRQEARAALAWIKAKPDRRKTCRGYPAFFVAWLSRSNDAPKKQPAAAAQRSGPQAIPTPPPIRSTMDPALRRQIGAEIIEREAEAEAARRRESEQRVLERRKVMGAPLFELAAAADKGPLED